MGHSNSLHKRDKVLSLKGSVNANKEESKNAYIFSESCTYLQILIHVQFNTEVDGKGVYSYGLLLTILHFSAFYSALSVFFFG